VPGRKWLQRSPARRASLAAGQRFQLGEQLLINIKLLQAPCIRRLGLGADKGLRRTYALGDVGGVSVAATLAKMRTALATTPVRFSPRRYQAALPGVVLAGQSASRRPPDGGEGAEAEVDAFAERFPGPLLTAPPQFC
jgi:hypothetical protein